MPESSVVPALDRAGAACPPTLPDPGGVTHANPRRTPGRIPARQSGRCSRNEENGCAIHPMVSLSPQRRWRRGSPQNSGRGRAAGRHRKAYRKRWPARSRQPLPRCREAAELHWRLRHSHRDAAYLGSDSATSTIPDSCHRRIRSRGYVDRGVVGFGLRVSRPGGVQFGVQGWADDPGFRHEIFLSSSRHRNTL